jgi:hypothetical protein
MAEPLSTAREVLSNVTPATVIEFLAEYDDAEAAISEAASVKAAAIGARKRLRKRIETSGIDLEVFDRLIKDSAVPGEVRERRDAEYRKMMAWTGKPIGFQASLDVANDPATAPEIRALNLAELKRIDRDGEEAGKAGRSRGDNPWTPGTEAYQRWDTAFVRSAAEVASDLEGEGGGVAARRGRPPNSRNRRPRPQPEAGHEGMPPAA